eukprot:CAMPEP_0202901542 /NCGR_PEP_ID=MMETSP1392-20130828/14314_1 /ASSEMBLY_ACC=CAM_ASM_000868 /TAXON_ID=225041 /ORGANISM="Chlamydomonas chlamydogama, Strain SAG 11-48b" /LENGTH=485 /DNA_ID=CAMNT_0049588119 /DNA_START=189 /DNA_END=1646 /DNA_ORIENTATION=-
MTSAASAYNFPKASRGLESLVDDTSGAISVLPVLQGEAEKVTESDPLVKNWATVSKFKGKSGELLLVPGPDGSVSKVLLGLEGLSDIWGFAALTKLPPGKYALQLPESAASPAAASTAALAFLLGSYSFDRYKKKTPDTDSGKPQLVWPKGADKQAVSALSQSFYLARDLITTPAEDLGPQHLVEEARALAAAHAGASFNVIQGEELLAQGFPAIHTVGRACSRPPALIDIRWAPGGADAAQLPLLALVGKGVCFDSGGLNIKTAAGMLMMKKDMGGAALMLALAHVIMSGGLPVRLRVMVPAVENSISGNAYRPLDVLQTRAGITVENGNTDAEGRLILCDAMFEAATEKPDLLIDAATLTGAARVAVGADLPAVFSSDDGVWEALNSAANEENDPLWRLPLYKPYRKLLDSKVADIKSCATEGPGAITAALYLQEFVKDLPRWVHIDTGAYNNSSKDGRPEGGEAQALRALWRYLQQRYPKRQ